MFLILLALMRNMFAQSGGRHGRPALSPRATGVGTAGPLCGCALPQKANKCGGMLHAFGNQRSLLVTHGFE